MLLLLSSFVLVFLPLLVLAAPLFCDLIVPFVGVVWRLCGLLCVFVLVVGTVGLGPRAQTNATAAMQTPRHLFNPVQRLESQQCVRLN